MKNIKYKYRKVYIFVMEKGLRKPFIILQFYLLYVKTPSGMASIGYSLTFEISSL